VVTPTHAPTATATAVPPTAPTAVVPGSSPSVQNLALGKAASQSSNSSSVSPALAVDGNTDGNYRNASTTHTLNEAHAWWQVDLGTLNTIQSIRLWNRTDCCSERLSNLHVIVSDVPFGSTDLQTTLNQRGVSDYYFTGTVGKNIEFNIGRTGRYVRIQLAGTNYLSLAEVQVLGTPYSAPSTVKNDDINTSTSISQNAGWVDQINTNLATTAADDPAFTCGKFTAGQGTHSVWYQFTPGKTGKLTLSTDGSTFDTVLAVWTGQRGKLTLAGCNDDLNYPANVQSNVQVATTAGQTYYVEAVGWGPYSAGNLKLSSSFTP